jgi:hypothetical protein
MRLVLESRVIVPQAIEPGLRSIQDPHNMPSRLSHERKKHCESLCTEATIDGLILLARNYPVAIVRMVSVCQSVVNGLHKVADCRYF